MLVCSYSASLQGSNVAAAVKYLMLLSGKGKLVKEQIQRLLLETRQFEALAGTVRGDGSRSNGALDEYFSKKEVSSLLAETAGDAIRAGKAADAAELLVLAGKYDALFSLMNRELASYLVVSTEEEFKKRQ
jgi:tryptophan synthase beta subunit